MTTQPTPPDHLQPPTAEWWRTVNREFVLEPHHVKLLTLAAEAWDRCCQAREAIAELGLTYDDAKGNPHPRPEVAIERDSRLAFARLIRELSLDVEPPPASSRPPRRPGT